MVKHGRHVVVKNAVKARKYVFDFFVIFVSIISSFALTEWQRTQLHRKETLTALQAVKNDLRLDTTNFNVILGNLEQEQIVLMDAMNKNIVKDSLPQIKDLLHALRAYHGCGAQKYGYHYLTGNIRNPTIYVKGILQHIGHYYEFTSIEGNFGGFNRDFYDIAFENHKRLFETFPNYLHPDTSIANKSIRDGIDSFLEDRYWMARIGLTYRQINSYNIMVYRHGKNKASKIISLIDKEMKY